MTFFQLGHARSLHALAAHLGERRQTLKNWSSKFHWRERINAFQSSRLEAQAHAKAEASRLQAADWARRALALRHAPRHGPLAGIATPAGPLQPASPPLNPQR